MSRMFPLLMIAVGATALSACAMSGNTQSPSGASERQCFYADQVDNFRGNNQTLYIRARNKDVFELKTLGYCDNIDFAFRIGFVPDVGGTHLLAQVPDQFGTYLALTAATCIAGWASPAWRSQRRSWLPARSSTCG